MYVTFASLVAVILTIILMVTDYWYASINWFYLVLGVMVSGWLGVIYYRVSMKKPVLSKDTIFFLWAK